MQTSDGKARLLTAGCSVDQAEPYGDCLTYGPGHYETWAQWRRDRTVEPALRAIVRSYEYEDWPRGRIVFDRSRQLFILYADRKLLAPETIARVKTQFHLPAERTEIQRDFHYQSTGTTIVLEGYMATGMKAFDVPGLAIGIVAGDKLIYAKGFGGRRKGGGELVDARTVFQIGSTTKAFLAASMAITVDHGNVHWDDRVIDLDPDFQLKDAWVTREFRVFDLLAQRAGLPPYANDALGMFGLDEVTLIRSLRDVEPVSSFRSTLAYTNITHLLAGRILAKLEGVPDWNTLLQRDLLDPLGMKESSYTAAAIKEAANHADGYRYTPDESVEVPFSQLFPYDYGGAGDINSTIEDMARWVRLNLGNGAFEAKRLVSPENLDMTRTPKVAINEKNAYALGWVISQTPNGTVVWHNGGTTSFGSYVGLQSDRNVGVIVLSNETNVGLPDAIGAWAFDRLMGNPLVDYAADALKRAKTKYADDDKQFARPASPRPFPPLAPLAGNFANPSFGKTVLRPEGDALGLEIKVSGAKLKLDPWDGDIFTAKLMPTGRFAAVVENEGPRPSGFVQFQIDKNGKLNLLRLSFDDGQAYEFRHE